MISPFKLLCNHCAQMFDSKNKQPVTGSCGHVCCKLCVEKSANEGKCRHCGQEEAFSDRVPNYAVLEILEKVKNNVFEYYDQIWKEDEEFHEGFCSKCRVNCENLRICVDCGVEKEILSVDTQKNVIWEIFDHIEAVETYLYKDYGRFCSDCLLDKKTSHWNHETIPILNLTAHSMQKMRVDSRNMMLFIVYQTIEDLFGSITQNNYGNYSQCRDRTARLKANSDCFMKALSEKTEHVDVDDKLRTLEKERHTLIRELEAILNEVFGTQYQSKLTTKSKIDDLS